jgi:hypothetical protein
MTFDKLALKNFLTIDEAARYLSEKRGESQDLMHPNRIRGADVLRSALDGALRLVVDVPTGTEDGEGRPIEAGLWDFPVEGAGRQQVEYNWRVSDGLASSNIDGIAGAWLERDGVRRQLVPLSHSPSALCVGCVLGVTPEALDALDVLVEKLSNLPSLGDRSKSELVPARWKDLTITFLSDQRVQMKIGDRVLPARTCEELQDAGFWDHHAKRHAKAWEALLYLAECNGTLKTEFKTRKHLEIRMAEIRKKLRVYLTSEGIEMSDSDPLPFDKRTRTYTATFTIGTNF